jgi:hypothetical protein
MPNDSMVWLRILPKCSWEAELRCDLAAVEPLKPAMGTGAELVSCACDSGLDSVL